MKFNKWTLGLAAIGVVSLASAAQADEKVSAVQSALSSTTISGYVDTSAQWNFGTGNEYAPPYKFGGPTKADGFNLDVIQLTIAKPLDEGDWAAGYRADLWMGPDANTLGTQSIFGSNNGSRNFASQGDFGIRQAYVALRAPIGNGLDLKVGVFDSVIGYESLEAGNNPNFTRSYGNSIEPQTHTGVLATYRFNDIISASVGIADTVGPMINNRAFYPIQSPGYAESYKTYMGSIALTAPDSMGWAAGSALYAGVVNGFGNRYNGINAYGNSQTSWYVGGTLATPVAGLKLGAAFDYLNSNNWQGPGNGDTWSLAGYASYQATEKLSLHLRGEYIDDRGYALYGSSGPDKVQIFAATATAQYDLWKNVISRLEFRWDHSCNDNSLFGAGAYNNSLESYVPTRDNAFMMALNVIYKF